MFKCHYVYLNCAHAIARVDVAKCAVNSVAMALRSLQTWGQFLEIPETFRAYFGCYNFPRILKTKMFSGKKFSNKFDLSYLEIIVKDQLSRISGSQF